MRLHHTMKLLQCKETLNKVRRRQQNWEKKIATDKVLILRIMKNSRNLTAINQTIQLQMARGCERKFFQMANRHMNKCSASLAIKETTTRFHFNVTKIIIII